jgi:ribonucleoside-diphosphate reductase alpha chain
LRSGGNTASCFILALEDDLDSIFANVHRVAKISKNGGGVGIFLGYLRAKGSKVNGEDNAAGTVVQWVKILNDTLVAVNQGGKRAGAGTVALPVWHNDILDFLDMQTEHGDQRMKAYDVFPQVVVPDIFMERDAAKQPWYTFCPYEVKQVLGIDVRGLYGEAFTKEYLRIEAACKAGKLKVMREIPSARDLVKQIMRVQFETGLPYITFVDTINEANPNASDPEAYGIPCVNLCTESFSNVKPEVYSHVCNLGSINMGSIRDMEHLAEVSRKACRILNRGVQLTKNPDETTEAHNKRYRTIGIGVMGLHDYLAREWSDFSDLDTISNIFECIQYNAALESVELAKELGVFEAFEHSKWKSGEMTREYAAKGCGKYDWDYLQQQIDLYGIHNSQLTSPAPTTSTSLYQDASASLLPIYAAFFSEDNKNGAVKVGARYLEENPVGYGKTQSKHTATEIIDVVATAQQWIDAGASMELIFDQNKPGFSAQDLYNAIRYAWEKKIKAIYYFRSVKERVEEACVGCSG